MSKIWNSIRAAGSPSPTTAAKIACGFAAALTFAAAWLFVPPPRDASAQFADQGTYGGTSTGSANAQAFTIANLIANKPGIILRFIPGYTNSGPTQINVSGIGLVNVLRPSSIGLVAFSGGEFQAGEETCVTWNSAASAYQLACNVDMTRIGQTVEYRGSAVPRGTLIEDGSCVSQTTYAALYSVIGTTYNATAPGTCGAGTFAVPDSRGTDFRALDNQGVNGAANRVTNAGSGCAATAVGLCGNQNQLIGRAQLPNTNVSVTITDPGHTHTLPGNIITEGGSSSIYGGGTYGAPNSSGTGVAYTGISAAFNLNGNVTQTSLTTLPPASLGWRAIKF